MSVGLHSKAPSVERDAPAPEVLKTHRSMTVRDSLYGDIEFPPVIRILVDSPILQRLRDLKQLGNSFYVYPCATHSRFQHSLGVCHLGMELYRCIIDGHREDRRNFGVPQIATMSREKAQQEMHCIGIAGLCHDLGHGPLSHMFETFVRTTAEPGSPLRKWSHEQASILLLRQLWAENRAALEELEFTDTDLRYVELLINGLRPGDPWPKDVGRQSWTRFTTEIIANKRSGLDVDKIDYIQRDSVACFGTSAFVSMQRLFQSARVVKNEDGETSIGFPDKLDGVIEDIFLARAHLHRIVYQHRVTKILNLMMLDALRAAGDHYTVTDESGREMPLRLCVADCSFYVHASDWVVMAILHSGKPELGRAREILQRVQRRELYATIGAYRYSEQSLIDAAHQQLMRGTSQELKHKVLLKELESNIAKTAPVLDKKMRDWSKAHGDLPSIEVLQAEITQSAGDMDKKKHPVEATYFFNARVSADSVVEPHKSCNVTTTLATQTGPVSSIVVVCRMPLSLQEKEILCGSFNDVADSLGATDVSSYSQTLQSSSQKQRYSQREPDVLDSGHPPQAAISHSGSSPAAKRLRLEEATFLPRSTTPAGTTTSSMDLKEEPPVGETGADGDEREVV